MSTTAKTISELAAQVDGRVVGDGSVLIERVASLQAAGEGDIAFVDDEKFFAAASASRASCLIVPESASINAACQIVVSKPKLAFTLAAELLHPRKKRGPFVHSTAAISSQADVDLTVFIGAHVSVGENTRITAGTEIHAGASIGDNVTVGSDCVIHPNVVL